MIETPGDPWVWPPPALIPNAYALQGQWVWHDEMFLNNTFAAGQIPGWATVAGGGGSIAAVSSPALSARGVAGWTFTRSPVALPTVWRRTQGGNLVAANDYRESPLPSVAFWNRFRMLSAKPNPAGVDNYYVSSAGIAQEAAGVVEPINGFGIVFDPTLGVDQWVLRAWRAGVAIDLPLGIPWVVGAVGDEIGWSTVALSHRGDNGIAAWVGDPRLGVPMAPVGTLVGPEVQPSGNVQPYYNHVEQRNVGLSFDPFMQTDFVGIGGGW